MAVLKQRTAEELQNPDLNYYIAFNIPLDETNVKKIEEALISKRKTFARVVTPTNMRLIELKDDIDEIMLNDAKYTVGADGTASYVPKSGGRKAEINNARQFYLKRAIETARLICSSGYIEDVKIEEVAKKYFVKPEEVENGIKDLLSQGVQLKKVGGAKREISFSDFKKMDGFLRTLGKRDIYDFCELPPSSNISQLYAKQEELYSTYSKKANDAKAKAAMDLSGIGKVIFKSDAARKEYDTYLVTKDKLWDVLSAYSDTGIKTINDTAFMEFFSIVKERAQLSNDAAEKEVYAYMQYFKIGRETANKLEIAVCPYEDCKQAYVVKPNMTTCPHCKRSLQIKCWNCGAVMTYKAQGQACTSCGLSKEIQPKFEAAQKSFELLLKSASCTEMSLTTALNGMENVYPNYSKFPNSVIAKAVATAKTQIEQKKKEAAAKAAIYDKYVKDINTCINKRAYCQAETLLKKLKIEDSTYDTKELDVKIGTALKSAQQLVDNAKKYLQTNNESMAVDACCKALEICVDHIAAVQIIKNYPPKAPTILKAQVVRNSVKLDWGLEGDQKAVTYTVIRKVGSAPANDEDGEILEADLTINFFEDSAVVSAIPYYYAVYAERGGIRSALVKTAAPSLLFRDITNLHQEKVADAIKATWVAPDNVKGIEVYRKSALTPFSGTVDGDKIDVDGLNGFTDKKAPQDKYNYLIRCKYNYQGKDYFSMGIRVTYAKYKIPSGLTGTKIENTGNVTDYIFTCDEPKNGTIKLYTLPRRIDFAFGEADEQVNFAKKCRDFKPLDVSVLAPNKIHIYAPANSMMWVYPVVSNEQLFVICPPIFMNTIQGVEGINVINKGGSIIVEGSISPSVRNVIALISEDGYVEDINAQADKRICSYDTFIKENGFYIGLKPGLYYITLFAEFNEGGAKTYSRATKLPDVIDYREKETVLYAMDCKPSAIAPYKIKFTFKANREVVLPEIDIVRGYPKPLTKSSGAVIATIPGGAMKKKLFKEGYYFNVDITVDRMNNLKEKITLFFKSESGNNLQLKEVIKI